VRLLLVEDDRPLADELQSVLEASGYAVDRAEDGEDALYLGRSEDYRPRSGSARARRHPGARGLEAR
jgi:DNA-binding response OmpR family regulator